MKKLHKLSVALLALLLISATLLMAVGCGDEEPPTPAEIWAANATYKDATTFGSGSKTVTVSVRYAEFDVTLTLKTDCETLGAAMLEHGLIAGEQGTYGLYVKTVNGILADYTVDQSYWSLEQNETALPTGIDSTPIVNGASYELVYRK